MDQLHGEQAANSSLNKILILQKRALRLMYFSDRRAHAIPLFVRSGVLPLNMLYFKCSAILMHGISNNRAPSKISELFHHSISTCSYCGKPGHLAKACFKKMKDGDNSTIHQVTANPNTRGDREKQRIQTVLVPFILG